MKTNTKTAAIVLAAGSGTRMQADRNKMFLQLAGKTVLERTVAAFQKNSAVDCIVIVAKSEEIEQVKEIVPQNVYSKILTYTAGGKERQDSVLCGLYAINEGYERVLIHDGARPFVTDELIHTILSQLEPGIGVIAGVPAKDTIKRVNSSGTVQETLVRSELWNIQTPQCFYTKEILNCYLRAKEEFYYGTDDASLAERYGLSVRVAPAYYENIKLTTPEDLAVAEVFLKRLHME